MGLFNFFSNKKDAPLPSTRDIIIGRWDNDLDDGSGLHAIWGWCLCFEEDGCGIYSYWESSTLQEEKKFFWKRVSNNSIHVRWQDEEEWVLIDYIISVIPAPYAGTLEKLVDKNYQPCDLSDEGFWDFFSPLFRST